MKNELPLPRPTNPVARPNSRAMSTYGAPATPEGMPADARGARLKSSPDSLPSGTELGQGGPRVAIAQASRKRKRKKRKKKPPRR